MPFIEDLSGGQSQDSSHSLKKFKMRRRKIERKKIRLRTIEHEFNFAKRGSKMVMEIGKK